MVWVYSEYKPEYEQSKIALAIDEFGPKMVVMWKSLKSQLDRRTLNQEQVCKIVRRRALDLLEKKWQ